MAAYCKVYGLSAVSCAKTGCTVPIETSFELLSRVGPWHHVLNEGAHWHHLAIMIEPSVCCGDAALFQITLTT